MQLSDVLVELPLRVAHQVQAMDAGELASVIQLGLLRREKIDEAPAQAPATLGIQGEDFLEHVLDTLDYETSNVAKKGKKGDFIITDGRSRVLVDVKNYSSTVPSAEIDKLIRDIEVNGSINGGMMISLGSNIAGRGRFSIEEIIVSNRKVPVMYVRTNVEALIKEYTRFMFHIASTKRKLMDIDGVDLMRQRLAEIADQMDAMSAASQCIQSTKATVAHALDKATMSIMLCENRVRDCINSIRSVIEEHHVEEKEEATLADVLRMCKDSPPDAVESFKAMWREPWVTKTATAKTVILKGNAQVTVKFMKTCIKAIISMDGGPVEVRVNPCGLEVMRKLSII
jgi:hypothetical protein